MRLKTSRHVFCAISLLSLAACVPQPASKFAARRHCEYMTGSRLCQSEDSELEVTGPNGPGVVSRAGSYQRSGP